MELLTFADGPSAMSYGLVDEIASRALSHSAKVMGVRKSDIPGEAKLCGDLALPVLKCVFFESIPIASGSMVSSCHLILVPGTCSGH